MIYVVQSGDSLTSIAKRYGVSLERLRSDNGLLPGTAPGARAGIGCFHSEGDLPG